MALFNNFPWTNFHELNLDWIIHQVKEIQQQMPEGLIGIPKGGTGADNADDARHNLGVFGDTIQMYDGISQTIEQAMNIISGNVADLDDKLGYRLFKTVTPLELTPGSTNISSTWIAMSAGDVLACPPDQFTAGECPESYGTLLMIRSGANSGCCLFLGATHMYRKIFSSNYPQAGWEQIFTDGDIVPVSNGGTGADNAADAIANLGIDFSGEVLSVAGIGADLTGDVPLHSYDLLNIYESITDLGLGSGSTISAVWNALNYGDRITFPASEVSNGPSGVSGTIDIYRGTASQTGWISFYGATESDGDYRMHLSGGNPDGTWLSVLTSAAIITENVSLDATSVAAYDNHEYTKSVAKTGYTPLGILGIQGSGSTGMMITDYYLDGTTAYIWSQNTTSSSKTVSYVITILYKKN